MLPPGAGPAVVVQDSPVSASIDGQQCLGMVALHKATNLAVAKAKQSGVGIVGVHNTASTTGALGCATPGHHHTLGGYVVPIAAA